MQSLLICVIVSFGALCLDLCIIYAMRMCYILMVRSEECIPQILQRGIIMDPAILLTVQRGGMR